MESLLNQILPRNQEMHGLFFCPAQVLFFEKIGTGETAWKGWFISFACLLVHGMDVVCWDAGCIFLLLAAHAVSSAGLALIANHQTQHLPLYFTDTLDTILYTLQISPPRESTKLSPVLHVLKVFQSSPATLADRYWLI